MRVIAASPYVTPLLRYRVPKSVRVGTKHTMNEPCCPAAAILLIIGCPYCLSSVIVNIMQHADSTGKRKWKTEARESRRE